MIQVMNIISSGMFLFTLLYLHDSIDFIFFRLFTSIISWPALCTQHCSLYWSPQPFIWFCLCNQFQREIANYLLIPKFLLENSSQLLFKCYFLSGPPQVPLILVHIFNMVRSLDFPTGNLLPTYLRSATVFHRLLSSLWKDPIIHSKNVAARLISVLEMLLG